MLSTAPPEARSDDGPILALQVGTYNVNGRRPPQGLSLRPWLDAQQADADIVAVGFQEIVPLSAGNVVMGMLSLLSQAHFPVGFRWAMYIMT